MSAAPSDEGRSGTPPGLGRFPTPSREDAPAIAAHAQRQTPSVAEPSGVASPDARGETAASHALGETPDEEGGLPRRRTVLVGAATTLVITALGVPLLLLWRAVAPGVPVVKTEDGGALTESQPEQFAAADSWFALLGFGFGVVVAVLGWLLLRRYRGPVGLLAVVWGGIGASLVVWGLSRWWGRDEYQRLLEAASVGDVVMRPPELRAGRLEWIFGTIPAIKGSLLLPAFGAAVAYTLLAGWSRYASLGAEPDPELNLEPDAESDSDSASATAPEPGTEPDRSPGREPGGSAGPVSSNSPARRTPSARPAPPAPDSATPPPD